MNKVEIPMNKAAKMLGLMKKVYAKHEADGDSSPLKGLDWENAIPAIEEAINAHEMAEKLNRDKKEWYQRRDRNLSIVAAMLRDSRDVLTGFFKKEMKILGQWGFNVSEFTRKRKASSNTAVTPPQEPQE